MTDEQRAKEILDRYEKGERTLGRDILAALSVVRREQIEKDWTIADNYNLETQYSDTDRTARKIANEIRAQLDEKEEPTP